MSGKAGIACDNYKLGKFKEELEARGFTDYTVSKLTKDTSVISVVTTPEQHPKLADMCFDVEEHFKKINFETKP